MNTSSGVFAVVLIVSLGSLSGLAAKITYREVSGENILEGASQIPETYFKDVSGDQKRAEKDERTRKRRSNTITTKTPVTTTVPSITKSGAPENKTITSDHKYYTSRFLSDSERYFKDLKPLYDAGDGNVTYKRMAIPENIASSLILYTTRKLKFVFPFYGHDVDRVIVTSAGFLHIGPVVHSFAHDVHYVAPLMADFATSSEKPVNVYIHDDGARFIAQWDNLYETRTNNNESFTFQVSLFQNGTIVFSYKSIPYSLVNFISADFPPKVGLSDGFVRVRIYHIPGTNLHIPFRIIYRYHTVALKQAPVKANSSYILTPVPNCIQAKSCKSCFSKEIAKNFKCKWCSKLNLCSDTFDWHRQKWENNGCPKTAIDSQSGCGAPTSLPGRATTNSSSGANFRAMSEDEGENEAKRETGIAIGVCLGLLVVALIVVVVYGYRNPTSRIGLFMIQNRPRKLFSKF